MLIYDQLASLTQNIQAFPTKTVVGKGMSPLNAYLNINRTNC